MSEIEIFRQLKCSYFESVRLDSFLPVTKSQNMNAHQITSRRSRRTADLVTGFTNNNTGVRNRSRIPQKSFTLALCGFTLSFSCSDIAESYSFGRNAILSEMAIFQQYSAEAICSLVRRPGCEPSCRGLELAQLLEASTAYTLRMTQYCRSV